MVRARRAPLARSTSLPQSMSARKSAAVSAGGINVRRLMLSRESAAEYKSDNEDEEEEIDKTRNNECGNPFCRQLLTNRCAHFCEDKPMCQRYRALKLQCLANAQADLDHEDTQPLSSLIKKKKKKEKKKEFAIPRKSKKEGKKRLGSSVENSGLQLQQKKKKKVREGAESSGDGAVAAVPFSRSPSVTSSVSSVEELAPRTKKVKNKVHSRPETVETAKETNGSRVKKRRLSRHTSADDVLSRSAPSSPVRAAAAPAVPVTETNWKIPRAKPVRPRTAAQAIRRSTNVELVPLGVANPSSFPGGGRYVQNGNRSTAQSLRTSDPRARTPKMTKFASPAVPAPAAVPTTAPVPIPQPIAQPSAPPEQPHLRPLPSQAPFSTQPVPLPSKGNTAPPPASVRGLRPLPAWMTQQTAAPPPPGPAPSSHPAPSAGAGPQPRSSRFNTPLSAPVDNSAVLSGDNTYSASATYSNAPAAKPSEVHRISTADYRKNKKSDTGRRREGEYVASRSSSLERSTNFPGDRASEFPPPVSYPTAPPGYRRNDSAPLPTYRDFGPPVDPRRQYPGETRPYYDADGNRIEYQDRPEGRADVPAPGQWRSRNYPPPHDYPPPQQEISSFDMHDDTGYDYQVDTRYNPPPPPVEQSYWREPSRGEPQAPPPPKRPTSPHRGEMERVNGDQKRPDHNDLPLFSYHDEFLPRLLSVFIHKFPGSLEAVLNVTKKPRKMNWYIKYVERIERLCKEFDLQIKFEGLTVKVTVRGREWLTLRGSSTVTLYLEVIKGLREEAITWRVFHEKMEKAVAHCTGIQAKESICFLRAWNDLKNSGNYISLARQANYFCGARLHHWNFVIGKVEIGSGSHEDKREAFRLATVSALDFLLSIGTGRRIRKREAKSERALDPGAKRRRSSSRESTANARDRAPPINDQGNGNDPPLATAQAPTKASEIEEHPSDEPPASNPQPESFTEPLSSSHVTQTNLEEPAIPATNVSNEPEAEQSDPGEEMSISDTSDVGTPAASPRAQSEPSTGVPLTVPESGKATASAAQDLSTSEATRKQSTTPGDRKLPATESTGTTPTGRPATGDGDSTAYKDTAVPLRRCMMCAMIRMRKPDGERCLRCQQTANGVLH